MMVTVLILFMLIGASGASSIARSKNRDPLGWFVAGMLFPLPAILVAAAMSRRPAPELQAALLKGRY